MATIVLDFDGVIIPRSESLKMESWEVLFPLGSRERALFEEAEARYGRGRGGDRFTILEHIYRSLGNTGQDLSRLVSHAAERFDAEVQARVISVGVTESDRTNLVRLGSLGHRLYLNSATPVDALSRTVDLLALGQFFVEVLGRPRSKVENFQYVCEKEKIVPAEIYFVGDSASDARAAQEFGCMFIAFKNAANDWSVSPECIISDLSEIERIVK